VTVGMLYEVVAGTYLGGGCLLKCSILICFLNIRGHERY